MTAEISSLDFEPTGEHGFYEVFFSIQQRLAEAAAQQRDSRTYRHFMIERDPETNDLRARFVLVSNYNEFLKRQAAEKLELQVPIEEADIGWPEVVHFNAPYFLVTYNDGKQEQTLHVTPGSYEEMFVVAAQPPIVDFEQKLSTYQLIPASMPMY